MRSTRLTVALSLVAASALPLAAAATPGTCPARVTTTDGWSRATGPAFTAGGAAVTAYAVDPTQPDGMVATNGAALARTDDGGCTWSQVFALPASPSADYPFSRDSARIVDLASGAQRAYAVVTGTTGTRVVVSRDGGRTWVTGKGVAAPTSAGSAAAHLVTDLDGSTAYLLVHAGASLLVAATDVLYASSDGGDSWAPRPVQASTYGGAINDVAVDPQSPDEIWLATNGGLVQSTDGGLSWSYTAAGNGGWMGLVSVTHRLGERRQVLAANVVESVVYVEDDGGSWTTVNTPGVVRSAAGGPAATDAAIATGSGVYVLDYGALTWKVVHAGNPGLARLATDYGKTPAYHACACDAGRSLWSRIATHISDARGGNSKRVDDNPGNPGFPGYYGCAPTPSEPAVRSFPDSAVSPAAKEITLAAGQSVTLPYRFAVQPRELDVYFMLPTGPRSYGFLCAEQQAAVWAAAKLARETNLRVGLGEYRDYQLGQDLFDFAFEGCPTEVPRDFVYKRDLLVGPVDAVFRQSVSKMTWGGNCTDDHANLAALYQLATGTGQDVAPPGPSPYDIRSGQGAGFAHDALRVVMHVSGSWFEYPSRTPGYPGPDLDTVVSTLRTAGIRQLGIYVPNAQAKKHEELHPPSTGENDLAGVATATGAVADRQVDCTVDSKLRVVLHPGDPLVCIYPYGDPYTESPKAQKIPPMGRQMTNLLGSVRDPRAMRLAVLSGDATVTAPKARSYDYLRANALGFSVTYRCGATESGRTKQVELGGEVDLGGYVGEQVVAAATATVHCGPPPPVHPKPVVAIVPPPLLPAPIPAAPGANPVPNPNPAPNPAAQPQSQPQSMAQGVAVPQEQSQPQLAYAENEVTEQTGPEYAMSRLSYRRRTPAPWLPAQLAALVMCATAAVAMARTATVRVRR